MGEIKDLTVSFLSLVKAPATGKALTLKSENADERYQVFELVKTDNERMVAYGVVYAPGEVDAHGDFAGETAIRRAAYEFMREARLKNIDAEHSFKQEQAYVAESWLVRKGDPMFPDEAEGAWVVGIQIGDPDLWEKLKSGEFTGISLAGIASMAPDATPEQRFTEKDDTPGWFKNWLTGLGMGEGKKLEKEKDDMDANEVRQIVTDTLKSALPDAIKDAMKSEETPPSGDGGDPPPANPPASGSGEQGGDDAVATAVSKAIAKGFGELEGKIDDKITAALAKGATETGAGAPDAQESFA